MRDNRDSIDFGKEPIGKLFRSLFFPTLIGLFSGVLLTLADGIIVGRGVGSNALAAINIAAPFYLITSGIALMFGSGASVVAAIHLGKGNVKAARINITQAYITSVILLAVILISFCCFPEFTCHLFGGNECLQPLFNDYLFGITPGLILSPLALIGLFVLRLDGSPKLAGAIQAAYSAINTILDYVFVFHCDMGIAGAAIATSIAEIIGSIAVVVYMIFFSKTLKLYRPKISRTAIGLYLRNVSYMMKLGFSNFLGEIAISSIMICGNFCFIARLGEDGVAAFSVACYLFPLIFMIGQAIVQSAQPIVSFNLGQNKWSRILSTKHLSYLMAAICGLAISVSGVLFSNYIAQLFLDSCNAYDIASEGLRWYFLGVIFVTMNIVMTGYCQSIRQAGRATIYTILRGFVFIIPAFIFLPELFGDKGLWLAIPVSEAITFALILVTNRMGRVQQSPMPVEEESGL